MMNEKIKSFAIQAGYIDKGSNITSYREFNHEKFAELIVKECADLLEKEAESGHDEGTASYDVLLTMSKWMKHYFGLNR